MPSPQAQRLDVNDPADVQKLVDTGLAWRSGPKTTMTIFRHIENGDVIRRPDKETPHVKAYLDKRAPIEVPPDMGDAQGEAIDEDPAQEGDAL